MSGAVTNSPFSAPWEPAMRELLSPFSLTPEATGIAASFLVLVAALFFLRKPKKNSLDFRDAAGEHIKVLPGDTRVARFVQGAEVSDRGKAIAGDEPYLVHSSRLRHLVIATPDQLRQFMANDSKGHKKVPGGGLGDYAARMLGSCVGQQHGEKWKLMRSHFDPSFSNHAARQAEPVFHKVIRDWLEALPPAATSSAFTKDALTSCHALAFRLLAIMSYGEVMDDATFAKLNSLTQMHKQMMMTMVLNLKTSSRLYNMLPTTERRQLKEFNRLWEQFNLGAIERARKDGLNCPVERIYAGVEVGDMSLVEFLQSLDEMLYTNIDITGLALARLLHNIAAHADFQARLRAEILGEKQQQSGYSAAAYAGKQDTLLHYATLESLRLNNVLHFSPPECTAEDKIIGGYRIPAQTSCIVDVRRINTNREAWGEDAETFRPERFAGLPASSYRFSMIRWGVGSSKCMGKNMADLLLKMTVIAVLERYELRPAVLEKGGGEQQQQGMTAATKETGIGFRLL
ncbi:cytochrome P450 monooxygenase [Chaetomium strumarium]|uniref:Cytochrome P450 monooxygenase n=1 Tax=Chaetomium strumarium TaxID=1170767 RepID=A0AAJ0H151_9PEZI|nr:cytochrome P450 monooxygenase [Chaetomium strumarium]